MRSVAVRARQATRARACECEEDRRDPGETKPKRGLARENPRHQTVCPHSEKFHPWKTLSSLSFRRAEMRLPSRTPPTAPLRPAHLSSFTMAGSDNPFVNADAWRKHPLLNGTWRHIAPGFFIGLTAFGAFYAYDKATQKKAAKH